MIFLYKAIVSPRRIIMRWEEETSERPLILDLIFSKEIVYAAYREGFINWNVYNKALEKINTNMNGIRWFEPETRRNE
jgi:hypothetical protein